MKIFITGINGFIGSNLAKFLSEKGHTVSGCSRGQKPLKSIEPCLHKYYSHHLLSPVPDCFQDIKLLIHGAYSSEKKNILHTNISGTKELYSKAAKSGVKNHIFISSYSAKKQSPSNYSILKYELETFFLQNKHPVVKPGLVLGRGGLFQSIYSTITKLPIVPLAGNGKFKIPIVSIPTFLEGMQKIMNNPTPKPFHLFYEDKITLKQLSVTIKNLTNRKTLFFPIPFKPLLFMAGIIEKFKIPFPFTKDSLLGLKQFETIKLESHLSELGIKTVSIEKIIKDLI